MSLLKSVVLGVLGLALFLGPAPFALSAGASPSLIAIWGGTFLVGAMFIAVALVTLFR